MTQHCDSQDSKRLLDSAVRFKFIFRQVAQIGKI